MKRQEIAELLDSDAGTAAEIAAALADLRFINRAFGGLSTSEGMIRRVARATGQKSFTWLEVAAGSGYVPEAVRQRMQRKGIQLEVSLLDRAESHLNNARNGNAPKNGVRAVAGDALALPFRDGSFDLVSCNLFVHHLGPEEVVRFVHEGLRVCRMAVLINDLIRHPLHLALTYAGLPLFRSRITWHDAPASVRQAYTPGEIETLIRKTTAADIEIQPSYLFRMGIIAWKKAHA